MKQLKYRKNLNELQPFVQSGFAIVKGFGDKASKTYKVKHRRNECWDYNIVHV